MSELAILVPVLNRPQNVAPLLESIRSATPGATVLFLVDQGDQVELDAVIAAGGEHVTVDGSYPVKINAGIRCTTEPLVFTAADDLRFHDGWFDAARAKVDEGFEVVGVNDLLDRPHRTHATHFLVTRGYCQQGQIDGEPGLMHERYWHWNCDDDLIATATRRGVYSYAEGSHVEHLHPMAGKAPDDATYQRGREKWRQDRRVFRERSHLWT
jgi:glycosyltransferase involved in cell wall biosynthesis